MRDMLGDARDAIDMLSNDRTVGLYHLYARLHASLTPYLAAAAGSAHRNGLPVARPLFVDYPAYPDAWKLPDEYQLGDDLVVAPVVNDRQRSQRVWIPPGSWIDPWTDLPVKGPRWVTLAAPPERIPLLVRNHAAWATAFLAVLADRPNQP